jgi:hypothetical protein
MTGWQATYAQLAAAQPVGTPDLRAQALDRWRSLPRYIHQEIANLCLGWKRQQRPSTTSSRKSPA